MSGPATATATVASLTSTATVVGGAGAWAFINSLFPPGTSGPEFAIDSVISIVGAFCWQFLYVQMLRQAAAAKGTPMADRPTLDKITLMCALCGAPLGTAALNYFIHVLGGVADAYSLPGYMAAGAIAPQLVGVFLGAFRRLLGIVGGGK